MDCDSAYCRKRFETIERRLDLKSVMLDKHNADIEVIKTDMAHLTKSLNALTKALWGVAGTTVAALFSFFIWYIQTLAR